MSKEEFYTEENRVQEHRKVHLSPSGRYNLTIDVYGTKPGCWSYTRGRVYQVEDGVLLGDVKRNYSSFPFEWVDSHVKTGHDYLICGEDYQGQTFINLTTGERKDFRPEEAKKGHGFCWSSYKLLPDGITLQVDGCYWACPYETRFYDVSNPMEGWPLLEGVSLDDNNSTVRYEDGVIIWESTDKVWKATGERYMEIESKYMILHGEVTKAEKFGPPERLEAANKAFEEHNRKYGDEDDDDYDEDAGWEKVPDHVIKLRREEDKLVLIEEWKSDRLQAQEKLYAEYRQKEQDQMGAWMQDPLYRELASKLEDPQKQTHFSYPSWNDRNLEGEKNPAFFSVSARPYKEGRKKSATLYWGVLEGDIFVKVWEYGKGEYNKASFQRTTEGMREAFETALSLVGGE